MTNSRTLKAIALGAAVAAALTSSIAAAEVTANAAITSNYIWRGITQTSDQAAGQGGIDWGHKSGLYAGTWVSNVDFSGLGDGYEMDVYAGFGGEAGGFGYDLGILTYQYPVTPNFNFTEIYASGTFSVVTIGINYTVDAASGNDAEKDPTATGAFEEGDMYVYGSLDFPSKAGDFSFYAGSYMFDNDKKDFSATGGADVGELDYVHYGASWGKGDFKFAVDKNDLDPVINGSSADNVRFSVMWSKDFELM
jgi:uncharacterized protein (TIGR02001 family)